ncbi:Haloalkane dehalogenase [Planctomycetes bacterium Pla163]|uniref:Haloalkane dehalogenase n=1 Tax=Rohdeia mirabilis TaxID=2528008 RepID=A0A518CYL8_9BACT|nr:Haloalkane dehalogenase [Planctomycetes bacterium Pla163]
MSELLSPRKAALRSELEPLYDFAPHVLRAHHGGANGARVHFVDEGPRSEEAVVFQHGNPTWSFAWRRALAALRDRRRVVAVDMLGCGLSDVPRTFEYRLANHVATLESVIESLGLERVHLVLHDWGGAIGMGYARRHPEKIASITALNTAAFGGGRMPRRIALCRTPVLGEFGMRTFGLFEKPAVRMAVRKVKLTGLVRRGYLGPYASSAERLAVARFVQDIPTRPNHPSWDELARTGDAVASFAHLPTQLLWGERDFCFTPAFREQWLERLPHAEVHTFEEAGHYLFEDEPEAFVERLTAFLDRVDGGVQQRDVQRRDVQRDAAEPVDPRRDATQDGGALARG